MADHRLRVGAAVGALLSVFVGSAPGMAAFGPSMVAVEGAPNEYITLTDIAARGGFVAMTSERVLAGEPLRCPLVERRGCR